MIALITALALGVAYPVEYHRIGCWRAGPDAQLEVVALTRGGDDAVEVRLARVPQGSRLACWTVAQAARARLRPLGERLPAPVRIGWPRARDWQGATRALFDAGDSTRFADAEPPRVVIAGTAGGAAGELALVPRSHREDVPDSARVVLSSGERSVALTLSAAEVWALAWAITERGRALDPAVTLDTTEALELPQVDEPPRALPGASCAGQFRTMPYRRPFQDHVAVEYVVEADGRAARDGTSFLAWSLRDWIGSSKPLQIQLFACLGDQRWVPARYRGRPVAVVVRQEFAVTARGVVRGGR